ncbi:YlbF family regulator [Paenibacillus thermoaerophilus]|jgi:cell fate (sporulation/competence/biofilm development) regulator YmcA (YheA/YmcA/DUF963 family)|uniref:YlbF family regulator n=1 Tax=Paenibacillus thermoaerophilus TaxID=1215385 RepID=A0ABW2V4U9_9BACL|nr:YlbF family regulator [Paenibacillus thermoaerophilus]TMV13875.1 hypothetical protein FE781_11810 [Paenibacillus thermoaerophilus]
MSTHSHDHHHGHDHDHDHDHACSIPKYRVTDLVVREDILAKAKELAELIATSEEVRVFKEAERKIANHEHVQNLIKQIKKKQKEAVAFEHFQNQKMVEKIENEIAELQDQLDEVPLVQQFQQTQQDLNYLLQLIFNEIRDIVSEKIEMDDSAPESAASCGI